MTLALAPLKVLCRVGTAKADIDVFAPIAGELLWVLPEGAVVEPARVVALLGAQADDESRRD